MKVNSSLLSGVSIRSSASSSHRTRASSSTVTPLMRDQLSFKEIDLDGRGGGVGIGVLDECNAALKEVLTQLFIAILSYGIAVVSRRPRDYGSYVVEASFKAADKTNKIHQMMLPLRGVGNGERFYAESGASVIRAGQEIKDIAKQLVARATSAGNRGELIKLICVTAHEFGHFLSWQAGNHNKELREGLEFCNTAGVIRYGFEKIFAVYREEILAWNFGRSKLNSYKFGFLDIYDTTRDNSLATYYKELNLKGAPVGIHARMSLYQSSMDTTKSKNKQGVMR